MAFETKEIPRVCSLLCVNLPHWLGRRRNKVSKCESESHGTARVTGVRCLVLAVRSFEIFACQVADELDLDLDLDLAYHLHYTCYSYTVLSRSSDGHGPWAIDPVNYATAISARTALYAVLICSYCAPKMHSTAIEQAMYSRFQYRPHYR